MIKKTWNTHRHVLAYLFWGGITTVINIYIFVILFKDFHWHAQISNIMAWIASVLVAYISNKLYVFKSSTKKAKELFQEIIKFLCMRLVTLVLDIIIIQIGISTLHYNPILVKIIDNIFVIVSNYFFSKWIIFRSIKKMRIIK